MTSSRLGLEKKRMGKLWQQLGMTTHALNWCDLKGRGKLEFSNKSSQGFTICLHFEYDMIILRNFEKKTVFLRIIYIGKELKTALVSHKFHQ